MRDYLGTMGTIDVAKISSLMHRGPNFAAPLLIPSSWVSSVYLPLECCNNSYILIPAGIVGSEIIGNL